MDARVAMNGNARMCRVFFGSWIDANCSDDRTANNYRQAVTWFEKQFGKDRTLAFVTPAEFAAWLKWMKHPERLATSTPNKHAKRIRTLFGKAIDARLLTENPGKGTKIGSEVNRERDRYVSTDEAERIIDVCDTEWALIFGLCRFAGLRCPSEVQRLKWSDIDWDAGRIRIDSTKTGLRFCPLWPRLRPLLDAQWDAAAEGTQYVVTRHRGREANLRTQMVRLIELAGIVPWEKPFVNLRASCRTDLEQRFKPHVCDAWMGHSSKVAAKHYLQVTEDHWRAALAMDDTAGISGTAVSQPRGGVTRGVGGANQGQSGPICLDARKPKRQQKTRRDGG